MDSDSDKGGVDIGGNRQRKFGLPSWMVNNMERLNYVTDFEQYGCSPPETEGFLTDYVEHQGSRYSDNITTEDQTGFQDSRVMPTSQNHQSDDLVRGSLDRNRRPRPVLTNLRQDDMLVSSPDSTPCATPEPSPVIRRKVSIPHPGDTVLTNPGRWFYFGKLKKSSPSSVLTNPTSSINSENSDCVDKPKTSRSVKLVITNFDLNAVSPNSW